MFTLERQQLAQEAKVFVKNIPVSVSVKELHEHFAKVSSKLFVHVNTDEKGKRLNFGFVHFMRQEDAEAALEKLGEVELKGQKLQLSRWVIKEARQIAQNEIRRNLYIRNIPLLKKKTVETSLKTLFSKYGEIESMLVKKVPKLNSYYALASFKDPQAAQVALRELTAAPPILNGTTEPLSVSWYQRKTEKKGRSPQILNAIYFKNMKTEVTEQMIHEYFGSWEKVKRVVFYPQTGKEQTDPKKGYIVFENEISSDNILKRIQQDNNIKKLFIDEPHLELTCFQTPTNQQGRSKILKTKNMNSMDIGQSFEPFQNWPCPQYYGHPYPNYYLSYVPMVYYPPQMSTPAGFIPMYSNNCYYMPQDIMPEYDFNYTCYSHDTVEYSNSHHGQSQEKSKTDSRNLSVNTSNQDIKDKDSKSPSVNEEINEENRKSGEAISTDESDSIELDAERKDILSVKIDELPKTQSDCTPKKEEIKLGKLKRKYEKCH